MADEAQDTIQMDTTYGAGGQAVEDGQKALEKVANKHAHQEIKELTQKQKAALVIVAMGSDRASKIYKYLNEVDIEDITYEVARLGKTTNQQVEDTLDEFYKLCLTHKMMTDGGLDYARSVLEKAFGDTTAKNLLDKVSKTLASKPFNFFSKGDPKALCRCFRTSGRRLLHSSCPTWRPSNPHRCLKICRRRSGFRLSQPWRRWIVSARRRSASSKRK